MRKIKTYNIILSSVFPITHPRVGQRTGFAQKVIAATSNKPCFLKKVHTIRANYDLWKNRIDEVIAGDAELCLRQWSGKPYRSKTEVIKRLSREDGVGIQKLIFSHGDLSKPYIETPESFRIVRKSVLETHYLKICLNDHALAYNDGLLINDWRAWFSGYDLSKPLAIIHFTPFRY